MAVISVRNREVLGGSLIFRRGGAHARGSRGSDSGPIPDPLCQDDINLIVTCLNAVFKIVLTTYLKKMYIELRYCQYLLYGLTSEIK